MCADTKTDANNCGMCGKKCDAGQACTNGMCKCPGAGEFVCGDACVNTNTDPMHCGSCDIACASGEMCCSGKCANLQTSMDSCGMCGKKCDATASDACMAGACKCGDNAACEPGFLGIGGTCSSGRCQ
jgi:hypothetical protein